MVNIETRLDQKRGCGWRKPGGLYMVAGGPSAGCGRLPIPLTVCPTCNCGIKPTRGFTWIDTAPLIAARFNTPTCKEAWCQACPVGGAIGRHGLLWVGGSFYERPADWTSEAIRQGVSRRISQIPKDFKVGETWVLVAHREAIPQAQVGPAGERIFTAGIFHAFKPSAIEYVCKGDETEEELERLVKRGITPVNVVKMGDQIELESGIEEDETVLEDLPV